MAFEQRLNTFQTIIDLNHFSCPGIETRFETCETGVYAGLQACETVLQAGEARAHLVDPADDGGDRFIGVRTAPDAALFAIIDLQGHGKVMRRAADRAARALRSAVIDCRITHPSEINRALNLVAIEEELFIATTVIYRHGNSLLVSCAGSRGPLLIADGRSARELDGAEGPLLGPFPNPRLPCREYTLGPRESVVYFSDGVPEAQDSAGEFFDPAESFPPLLDDGLSLPSNVWRLFNCVVAHCGDQERDDIALGLIRGRQAPLPVERASPNVPAPMLSAHARAGLFSHDVYECATV